MGKVGLIGLWIEVVDYSAFGGMLLGQDHSSDASFSKLVGGMLWRYTGIPKGPEVPRVTSQTKPMESAYCTVAATLVREGEPLIS